MSNKTQTITYQVTVNGNRQEWRLNGKLHRLDGPAIVNGNRQEWWLYGKCHRLDGPAVINGKYQAWYIEGKSYSKEQFDEKTKKAPCANKEVIIDGVTYKLVPKETS